MRAYSVDLRQRIVRAVEEQGKSKEEVVKLFGTSLASVNCYLKQHRDTGELKASSPPGGVARIKASEYPLLRAQLEAHNDASLAEHARQWQQAHGTQLSVTTMWRTIRRLGYSRKKDPICLRTRPSKATSVAGWRLPTRSLQAGVYRREWRRPGDVTRLRARSCGSTRLEGRAGWTR